MVSFGAKNHWEKDTDQRQTIMMAKPRLSFLNLPRELRQKIIAETYDIKSLVKRYAAPYYHRRVYELVSAWKSRKRIRCTRGTSGYEACQQFVQGVCSWTQTLREVDDRIVEDIEYAKDKFGNGSRELLAILREIGFDICQWRLSLLSGEKNTYLSEPWARCLELRQRLLVTTASWRVTQFKLFPYFLCLFMTGPGNYLRPF